MAMPVHIITGFLGSGKTTLIHSLIRDKPVDETWAILVNEFGQIGIDQAMFEQRDDVVIKGLPGGCLCCQLAFVLQAGLVNLLARAKPDRVIIEPSGLGHPAGLIDLLRSEAFEGTLEIRDIIATLHPFARWPLCLCQCMSAVKLFGAEVMAMRRDKTDA